MNKERVLMMIRHEAIQRSLIGKIINRIEEKGLKIIAMKMCTLSSENIEQLYYMCLHEKYWEEMKLYNTEIPIILLVLEGFNASKNAKDLCGKYDIIGSIRGDFSSTNARNNLHCSDPKDTNAEIEMFFKKNEIMNYTLSIEQWLK